MHLFLSILAPLGAIIAPLINFTPTVQAGPSYAIAAVRTAKPIACGKDWKCFQKAVTTCKPATIKQTLTKDDQGIISTVTNTHSITGKDGDRCNFSLTIFNAVVRFGPKGRALVVKEAKSYGLNPNQMIHETLKQFNDAARAGIGKDIRCAIAPPNLTPLVAKLKNKTIQEADWTEHGCAGTLLELVSFTREVVDALTSGNSQNPPSPHSGNCPAEFDAMKDYFTKDDAVALFGSDWTAARRVTNGAACWHVLSLDAPALGAPTRVWQIAFGPLETTEYERENRYRKDPAASGYVTLSNVGDDAFYRDEYGLKKLWIAKNDRRVYVRCVDACTEAQLQSIGQSILSHLR